MKKLNQPNIFSDDVLRNLVEGTFAIEGITLGVTRQNFELLFGKADENVINAQKSYQNILLYAENNVDEENAPYYTFWFEGDKTLDARQYQLRTIEFAFPRYKNDFSECILKEKLGQSDLEYRSGYQQNYCYGHTTFMYTEINSKWQLTNICYQDKEYQEEKRILFGE